MNGINLIPVHRIVRRRRAARLRVWMSIAPLCISVLAGTYGYLFATWETDAGEVSKAVEQTEAVIRLTKGQLASSRASLSEASARLKASRAISNQPDWGLLLDLLARQLGDEAVLSSCVLDPVAKAPPSATPAGDKSKAGAAPDPSARPDRYRLTLGGVARTQEAVPLFVQRLQDTGIFDSTKMVEAVRTPFAGGEAFRFQVECTISDTAGGTP